MKCKNCKKEMVDFEQLNNLYSVCQNKKCKFYGLIFIHFEESLKATEKFNEKWRNLGNERRI